MRLCLVQKGQEYTFTIRDLSSIKGPAFRVSYDGFVDDVQVHLPLAELE